MTMVARGLIQRLHLPHQQPAPIILMRALLGTTTLVIMQLQLQKLCLCLSIPMTRSRII